MLRCLYVDLDGTLLGPGGALLRGSDSAFSALGVRALEACARADVEVVIYSGRRQESISEAARLLGQGSYIFELGCGLVLDGELEWLTDGLVPSDEQGSIYDQITRGGAPALLLEHFAGRLEYHTPWSTGRDVSHLFRGDVDASSAEALLHEAGYGWLRLVDNGIAHEHSMPGLDLCRVYHLIPVASSKARAVARHQQARGYRPQECIAAGDSREDMGAASVVGAFWLTANALVQDPTLAASVSGRPGVRVCEEEYGAGVYEAVVSTLAEGRSGGTR